MTDKNLIQQFMHEGDMSALQTLLKRYDEGLFGYLRQMLKHQQDSEDALQDTFRKAINALPSYREENHFKSWLFRIGHNTAIEVMRRRRRTFEIPDNAMKQLQDRTTGPLESLVTTERHEALHEAIDALPELEKSVVLLRLHEDLTFKEIAEIVGAPLGTVLARMQKAKERLKTQLSTA